MGLYYVYKNMARKNRRNKRRSTKRRRRRRGFYPSYQLSKTMTNTNTTMPDKTMVKLKYCIILDRTGVGAADQYVFRGNSVFNPDFTGAGGIHPQGYLEWSNFYNEYRVYASKLEANFTNNTQLMGCAVSLIPSISSGGAASYQASLTTPYVKTKMLGTALGNNIGTLSNYITSRKVFGRPVKNEDNFAAISGQTGGNPLNLWFWVLEFKSPDSASGIDLQIQAVLTYWVEFSVRKQLDQTT